MIKLITKTDLDCKIFISSDEDEYNLLTLYITLHSKNYRYVAASMHPTQLYETCGFLLHFHKSTKQINGNLSSFNMEYPIIEKDKYIGLTNINFLCDRYENITINYTKTVETKYLHSLIGNKYDEILNDPITKLQKASVSEIKFSTIFKMKVNNLFKFDSKKYTEYDEEKIKSYENRLKTKSKITQHDLECFTVNESFLSNIFTRLKYFQQNYYIIFPMIYLNYCNSNHQMRTTHYTTPSEYYSYRKIESFLKNPEIISEKQKTIDLLTSFKNANGINRLKVGNFIFLKDNQYIDISMATNNLSIFNTKRCLDQYKYLNNPHFNFINSLLQTTGLYNTVESELTKTIIINL